MQLVLRPISHPELGEVVIRDSLFCVGREGEPLGKLPEAGARRLSRRHARLFEQDGVVYIVDLGSRNGTYVNGEPLAGQPRIVQSGDIIDFAGELTYRLELLRQDGCESTKPPSEVVLHLETLAASDGPDSLFISAFPFLVSKQAAAFAKYERRVPDELNYLSRRHAHVFIRDGRLFLEDLGSTNGTFVDDRRLGDEPVELHDGQTVAFGGDFFVYRVRLPGEQPQPRLAGAQGDTASPTPAADKTTFVSAATSFLDIFCADDMATSAGGQPDDRAESKPASAGMSKSGSLVGQLYEAFWGGRRSATKEAALLAVLLLVISLAGVFWLLQPSPAERIESLIAQGHFDKALLLASANDPTDDTEIGNLVHRALVAKTLPDWLDALERQDFVAMEEIVDTARKPAAPPATAKEYLELLSLMGEIEHTLFERGGVDAPLRVFSDEAQALEQLVSAWQRPKPDKRKVTERLLAALPPEHSEVGERYRTAYGRAASHMRALGSELAVYQPALEQLTHRLRTHLAEGSLDQLAAELDRLSERYRQFDGFDDLRHDLAVYRAILEASRQGQLPEAARLAAGADFHAVPFAEATVRLAQEALPSQAFMDSYAAALDDWRAGRVDAARAQLEPLVTTPWRDIAEQERQRMKRVASGMERLQRLRGENDYAARLLEFHASLDSDRDRYFLQSLQSDYVTSLEAILQEAGLAASAAAEAWADYERSGRITSTQRLAPNAAPVFRERAKQLANAAVAAQRAVQAYALAGTAVPMEQRQVLDEIAQEVAVQHQSLDELSGVLDDTALNEKRILLPRRGG